MSELQKVSKLEVIQPTTPATLLQMAVEQGADLDRLEKLMDLQQRWEASEARKAYTVSMAGFQTDCPVILKNKSGHNSKYASLAHTLETIGSLLSKYGFSRNWKTTQLENGLITVDCTVTHKQGHSESTSMSANPDSSGSKNNIQAIGSTVSYLQRYTLYALLGLASKDQDDDANGITDFITEEQAFNLQALLEEVEADKDKFFKFFKVDSFELIPKSRYNQALQMLLSKRGKK